MFVFEKGDPHQDEIIQMLRRDRIDLGIDPIFAEKRWHVGESIRVLRPLECADFLAYEHHKVLMDAYLRSKGTARTSLWALQEKGAYFGVEGRANSVIDGRFFELSARGFNLPRRAGAPMIEIPYEFNVLKDALKSQFLASPVERQIKVVPRPDPLPKLKGA